MNSPTSHTPIKSANGVRIYPNPAKNIIQIESEPLTSIQAIDMHGKRFKIQIEGRSINVSDLPKGIYIFELLDSNGKYWREKVVIGD